MIYWISLQKSLMIFLITIWILSIIAVTATLSLAYAGYFSDKSVRYISKGIPVSIWDLFVITYKDVLSGIVDRWHDVLPHIHNATTYTLTRFIAHRDRVTARMFGYHAVPQGGVVSFFLKRIVVHKEEFKQKVAQKRALHDTVLVPEKRKDYFGGLKGELKDL